MSGYADIRLPPDLPQVAPLVDVPCTSTSVVAAGVGLIFYFAFKWLNMTMVGIIIMALFALIGFGVGTLKVPEIAKFEFSKKTGGENIDDIIKRAIMFKMKGKKLYVYKEGKSDE